jgi:hypothetical protein
MSLTLFIVFKPDAQQGLPPEDWTLLSQTIYSDLEELCQRHGIRPLKTFVVDFIASGELALQDNDGAYHSIREGLVAVEDILDATHRDSKAFPGLSRAHGEVSKLKAYLEAALSAGCELFYIGII